MRVRRLAKIAAIGLPLLAMGACQKGADLGDLVGANAPLSPALVKLVSEKGMGQKSPILIRLYKEESQLEVWKQKTSGDYALLKTYSICAWSGKLGPKKAAGDRQAPEGFYNVTPGQMNPESQYHLAFNIGYPNQYDKVNGASGEHLMVHGSCNSSGCYAMDDWQVEELYALAREAFAGGQRAFQFQAYPFRMTAQNMARHRQSEHYAFWKTLKEGADRFEVEKKPVPVGVCEKRYFFNGSEEEAKLLGATQQCPQVQPATELVAKRVADEAEEEKLVATMAPTDFAKTTTFSYKTGMPITAEAYAAEQHRRPGFDRLGKPVEVKSSVFGSMLGR